MDTQELLALLIDAWRSNNKGFLAAAIVVAAVWAVRKLAAPKVAWLRSDLAGVVLAFLAAGAGALATTMASGSPFGWAMLLSALKVAVMAMGSYSVIRKALGPLLKDMPWAGRFLDALFGGAEQIKEEAEQAGKDAVAAKPPTGAASITGEPTDVS